MQRFAMNELLAWKARKDRKPLILRGARQVGKTWLVREFGRLHYKQCLYVNFDLDANPQAGPRLDAVFASDLQPRRIVAALEILFETRIDPDDTLIFFDEIQEQPRALNALKYFNELAPEYHVVAAGSHLGMTLHQGVSFPVGKVEFLYLHPMSFDEFLRALGKEQLADLLAARDWPLLNAVHSTLVEYLRQYYCIGGMPEVVADYAATSDPAQARALQRNLLELVRADFSKHAPPAQLARIWQVWDSIPVHLARENRKFVFGALRPGARAKDFELALQWLYDYGLASAVVRIQKPDMPIDAYAEAGVFKLYMLDVGLLGAMAGLDVKAILEGDRVFTEFKGALVEQYVFQQLTARAEGGHYGNRPYYWAGKAAEVDFVMQFAEFIVPIEVKAAENLRSQSLKSYIAKYRPERAFRVSLSPYRAEESFVNLPLYAVEQLPLLVSESAPGALS